MEHMELLEAAHKCDKKDTANNRPGNSSSIHTKQKALELMLTALERILTALALLAKSSGTLMLCVCFFYFFAGPVDGL